MLEHHNKGLAATGARVTALGPGPRARIEVLIVVVAMLTYFGVRHLTEGAHDTAVRNAYRVVDLQEILWLNWDMAAHRLVRDSDLIVTLMNWTYTWGHWPVILISGAWLFLRFPGVYYRTRNAFLISGAIGFIFFATFPVAPPRLTDLDVVDTVTRFSDSYRVLQPVALTNQYAAMPSLHFGWNLLIGIALVRTLGPLPLRVVAGVFPGVMAAAVVLTANHFILDAIVGGALALVGLVVATWLERRLRHRGAYKYLVPLEEAPRHSHPAGPTVPRPSAGARGDSDGSEAAPS